MQQIKDFEPLLTKDITAFKYKIVEWKQDRLSETEESLKNEREKRTRAENSKNNKYKIKRGLACQVKINDLKVERSQKWFPNWVKDNGLAGLGTHEYKTCWPNCDALVLLNTSLDKLDQRLLRNAYLTYTFCQVFPRGSFNHSKANASNLYPRFSSKAGSSHYPRYSWFLNSMTTVVTDYQRTLNKIHRNLSKLKPSQLGDTAMLENFLMQIQMCAEKLSTHIIMTSPISGPVAVMKGNKFRAASRPALGQFFASPSPEKKNNEVLVFEPGFLWLVQILESSACLSKWVRELREKESAGVQAAARKVSKQRKKTRRHKKQCLNKKG